MSTTPSDPMEFLKSLWGNTGMPLPGLVTPTLDTNELEKRITDLKAVEGVVQVGFIIEKDGSVSSIKIIHSLSDVCDRAALQVIQSMNDLDYGWEPAQLNKKYVDYFYTYDVEFNLKKEKKRRSKK